MASQTILADDSAVSPVIGVILMVAITVVLAAVVFFLVNGLTAQDEAAPEMQLYARGDSLMIQGADHGIPWSDLLVTGCINGNTGNVTAGQTLTDCAGSVTITHTPTNQLIYSHQFP
jgi:archaeal type IV pilus assembly protein PilA